MPLWKLNYFIKPVHFDPCLPIPQIKLSQKAQNVGELKWWGLKKWTLLCCLVELFVVFSDTTWTALKNKYNY